MRRTTRIAAVVSVIALALAGCGKDGSGSDSADACKDATGEGPKVGLAYDVGGRGDQSFNDSAYEGMKQAIADLDATCIEAKAAQGENDATRAERLRTLADQGYDPIIAIGFIYSPAARIVAKEYPDIHFGVIDGYSLFADEDPDQIGKPLPNLADLTFAEEQGSFLVGVAAALKTETKHVGFVGGTHGDLIKKFEAGYVAGVHAVDPSITVDVKYLTEDPTDGATGFENPAGGKTAAQGMYDGGADIVYHAAGKSGLGVFDAVEEAGEGNWAIGVDSDQYLTVDAAQKPFILTSMIKRVDTAVFDFIQGVADGDSASGNVTYDLKVDGVGYSTSGGFIDDIKDQIDGYAKKIISGELKVPTAPEE
ncbi:MAG: BMP family ABC transporter substrate-binding protein [Nocardioidaceae bacterium]